MRAGHGRKEGNWVSTSYGGFTRVRFGGLARAVAPLGPRSRDTPVVWRILWKRRLGVSRRQGDGTAQRCSQWALAYSAPKLVLARAEYSSNRASADGSRVKSEASTAARKPGGMLTIPGLVSGKIAALWIRWRFAVAPGAIHVVIRDQAGFHLRDGDFRLPLRVRIIDLPVTQPVRTALGYSEG